METVWIVMYIVGWDGLEQIDSVFSSELKAINYVSTKPKPSKYEINEYNVE